MIWAMATAMASPTSTPGWCVPELTGFGSTGLRQHPSGTRSSTQSKNPSFFGMEGSTRLASWAMALPRVLPKVDQPEMCGRVSDPSKSRMSRSPSTVTAMWTWRS